MANVFRIRPNGQLRTVHFIKPFTGSVLPSVPTDYFRPALYTLTATADSFTLTGQTAALKIRRLLPATAGSITVTGQTVTLTIVKLLTAVAGSLSVSGQTAGLSINKILPASPGSIVITGQTVALKISRLLPATAGSYILGGYAGLLYKGYLITLNAGSFTLAGEVGFKVDRKITGPGSYTVAGLDVTLEVALSKKLIAGSGSFSVRGSLSPVYRKNIVFYSDLQTDIITEAYLQPNPEFTVTFKTEYELSTIFV